MLWLGTLLCSIPLAAQTLVFSIPDTTVAPAESVVVPIRVVNFDEIVSVQFSLTWDTDVIAYEAALSGDLENVAVGDFQSTNGELRVSWFDVEGQGRTLPDSSIFLYLQFAARGSEGSSSPVSFTDMPLPTQVFRATGTPGEFDPVTLELVDGKITIVTPGNISVDIDAEDVSCAGQSDGRIDLTITSNAEYTVNWSGPGLDSEEEDLSDLPAGAYRLAIRDTAGEMLFETTVDIDAPEALRIDALDTTDAGCTSGTGSAAVTVQGGTMPYRYDIGNGPGSIDQLSDIAPGNYQLEIIDNNGCSVSDTFSIRNSEGPIVELGQSNQICDGESLDLHAGDHATYEWSTGETTPDITINTPGTYAVTVTDEAGCVASDAVEIKSGGNVQLFVESEILEICPGDSVQLVITGADQYHWIDTSGTLSDRIGGTLFAFPETTTGYTVVGSTNCGTDTLSLEVFVFPVDAAVGPDTCVAPGTVVRLSASGGVTYQWIDNRFPVSDPVIAEPSAMPEDSTTYVVFITDRNGCVTVDSTTVLVANDPISTLKLVNMITPNGDDRNDELEFNNLEKFGPNVLKIFNRWGNLVYQKVNYQSDEERFNGTYKGEELPPGTYYYLLSFRTTDIRQKLTIVRE